MAFPHNDSKLSTSFKVEVPNIPYAPSLDSIEPILSCRFVVTLNNVYTYAFTKVSGIGRKNTVKYVAEGGNNTAPIMLRCANSEPQLLTFEQGLQIKEKSLIKMSRRDAIENRNSLGFIMVLDMDRNMKAMYQFISQGIVSWEVGMLDSMSSTPIIEKFTIAHTGLHNVPLGASIV